MNVTGSRNLNIEPFREAGVMNCDVRKRNCCLQQFKALLKPRVFPKNKKEN